MAEQQLLKIKDLRLRFKLVHETVNALGGVDLEIYPGESVGIGGESGCGKSVTVQAAMGLLPAEADIYSGQMLYRYQDGREVDIASLRAGSAELLNLRKKEISMVFQEPSASLSPLHTVYRQMEEAIEDSEKKSKTEKMDICENMLARVGIRQPERWLNEYPFRLSGGMAQRVMIAQALVKNPRLLFADEPTTALDVTVQAQVLLLIEQLRREFGIATVYITHNMGILAHMTERIYIMYLGRIVESGKTGEIFANPLHPYTKALISCTPTLGMSKKTTLYNIPGIVSAKDLSNDKCSFYTRCEKGMNGICDRSLPQMAEITHEHFAACHLLAKEG